MGGWSWVYSLLAGLGEGRVSDSRNSKGSTAQGKSTYYKGEPITGGVLK